MRLDSRSSRPRALVALCVPLASLSCGGGDSSPASPGVARPAAASTQGLSGACYRPGPGDPRAVCGQAGSPKLVDEVETAIDLVVQRSPQLFDKTDVAAPNTGLYRVVDSEGYLDAVAQTLRVIGVCTQRDPNDLAHERILAKTSNESSEAYDVLTSDGYIRRGSGSFVDLCRPASFPIERAPETPPPGLGCQPTYPPPVTHILCAVHLRSPEYDTLDATPLVGPDAGYCAAIGYTDGRSYCPVRMPGAPDRLACEVWRVGIAKDTKRPGPTWTKGDGSYCTGLQGTGCQNSPDNQFQLWVYTRGPLRGLGRQRRLVHGGERPLRRRSLW